MIRRLKNAVYRLPRTVRYLLTSLTYYSITDFQAGATSYNPILPPSTTIPITYASSDTSVAKISIKGLIHILSAGTTTITASQGGNNIYIPAVPQSQTLTVVFPRTPAVNITADHTSVCSGSNVTFTATVSNVNAYDNLFYQWQVNGKNTGKGIKTFSCLIRSSTDTVKCTVINYSSCMYQSSNSYSVKVDADVTPTLSIQPVSPVCKGSVITFSATLTNGGANPTYQWKVNGKNSGGSSNKFTSNSLKDNDQVTCIVTPRTGPCITTRSVTSNTVIMQFVADPSVTITASDPIYPNTQVTFTAVPVNASSPLNYQWQVNGNNVGTSKPTFTSSSLRSGDVVTCTLNFATGCTTAVTSNKILVKIMVSGILIPNTFSPNGDGINDTWVIQYPRVYTGCMVKVYNRYGQVVFSSDAYSNAWDGKCNGIPLATGTYYYFIRLKQDQNIISGSVSIVR